MSVLFSKVDCDRRYSVCIAAQIESPCVCLHKYENCLLDADIECFQMFKEEIISKCERLECLSQDCPWEQNNQNSNNALKICCLLLVSLLGFILFLDMIYFCVKTRKTQTSQPFYQLIETSSGL